MAWKVTKHVKCYMDSFLGYVMVCLMLTPLITIAADLPPSPDDVAAFKQEQKKDQAKGLKAQAAVSVAPGQKVVKTEQNQAPKEGSVSKPAAVSAKNEASSGAMASEGEQVKALEGENSVSEETKINALGNVVSGEDQSVSRKIKEWSKKLGVFYQTFEEYMGWDDTTRIRKLDEGCKANKALSCAELAETRQREGKTFEAETWYQLACGLMHSPSCLRYKRLASIRESYEEKLRQDRFEIETLCESGRGASCAKAAYIAKYFGEHSVSEALNLKSCELGYPAGCLQMARLEVEKGNVESASMYEKKGRELLEGH